MVLTLYLNCVAFHNQFNRISRRFQQNSLAFDHFSRHYHHHSWINADVDIPLAFSYFIKLCIFIHFKVYFAQSYSAAHCKIEIRKERRVCSLRAMYLSQVYIKYKMYVIINLIEINHHSYIEIVLEIICFFFVFCKCDFNSFHRSGWFLNKYAHTQKYFPTKATFWNPKERWKTKDSS